MHKNMKATRDHAVFSLAELAANPKLLIQAAAQMCPLHPTEEVRFYDTQCNVAVCRDCLVIDHHGHKCQSMATASAKFRGDLADLAAKAKARAAEFHAAQASITLLEEGLDNAFGTATGQIGAFERSCHDAITRRAQELLEQLRPQHKVKAFALNAQREALQTYQACLESAAERATEAQHGPSDALVLVAACDLAQGLDAINSQAPPLEPQTDISLGFAVNGNELLRMLSTFGRITLHGGAIKFEGSEILKPDEMGEALQRILSWEERPEHPFHDARIHAQLIHRATEEREQMDNDSFDDVVDGRTHVLVLIRSTAGHVFGAFVNDTFGTQNCWTPDNFIFAVGNITQQPIKQMLAPGATLNLPSQGCGLHLGSNDDLAMCELELTVNGFSTYSVTAPGFDAPDSGPGALCGTPGDPNPEWSLVELWQLQVQAAGAGAGAGAEL